MEKIVNFATPKKAWKTMHSKRTENQIWGGVQESHNYASQLKE